jgi:hypothetical protein
MADIIYNSFKKDLINGLINLEGDTIKVMLVTSAYVPDQDSHSRRSNITNEIVASGYTAGGKSLSGKTIAIDNATNKSIFDALDTSWTSATIVARGAVLYKSRGGASSADELIEYKDFGLNKVTYNGTFTINWNSQGILNVTDK